eukprot:jgi/Psemu1/65579/estExt_Genemark1.C_1350032
MRIRCRDKHIPIADYERTNKQNINAMKRDGYTIHPTTRHEESGDTVRLVKKDSASCRRGTIGNKEGARANTVFLRVDASSIFRLGWKTTRINELRPTLVVPHGTPCALPVVPRHCDHLVSAASDRSDGRRLRSDLRRYILYQSALAHR